MPDVAINKRDSCPNESWIFAHNDSLMAILGGQNDEASLDLRVRSNKQVHKILVKTVEIPDLRIKIVDV